MSTRKRRPGQGGASKTKKPGPIKYSRFSIGAQRKPTIAELTFARDFLAPWKPLRGVR